MRRPLRLPWLQGGACLASFLALALPARAQPTFEGLLKDWSALALKEARPVKDLKLSIGHAALVRTRLRHPISSLPGA